MLDELKRKFLIVKCRVCRFGRLRRSARNQLKRGKAVVGLGTAQVAIRILCALAYAVKSYASVVGMLLLENQGLLKLIPK